ncbi:MAG: YciI family protein [Acidimicrobiales bacterium]
MKYHVLLVGYGELAPWDQMTPDEQGEMFAKFGAFDEACNERSGVELLAGEALEDASMTTTVRTRGGEFGVTDGPFAEATEQIGGFYLIEAPNLDTITDLCRTLPAYDIEIRPVVDMG